ncbi:MAG: hypothetical protein ACJ72N_25160 [Labedaea sp.]
MYLPKSWTDDWDRCAEAGIDTDVEFATKPVLARAHAGAADRRARPAGGAVVHRRRSLRRQPGSADLAGGAAHQLRHGGLL